MPRPVKIRKVGYIPENRVFNPMKTSDKIEKLSFVETEALRLSDMLHMDQVESAKSMDVSRGTFQRIIVSAREKVARAIIEGKNIEITGGQYRLKKCHLKCTDCGFEWQTTMKITDDIGKCPECGSQDIKCLEQMDIPCKGCGQRRRRHGCGYGKNNKK